MFGVLLHTSGKILVSTHKEGCVKMNMVLERHSLVSVGVASQLHCDMGRNEFNIGSGQGLPYHIAEVECRY